MKHKHHEAITAWSNGAKIEFRNCPSSPWALCNYQGTQPEWLLDHEYRVYVPAVTPEQIVVELEKEIRKLYSDLHCANERAEGCKEISHGLKMQVLELRAQNTYLDSVIENLEEAVSDKHAEMLQADLEFRDSRYIFDNARESFGVVRAEFEERVADLKTLLENEKAYHRKTELWYVENLRQEQETSARLNAESCRLASIIQNTVGFKCPHV